MEFSKLYEREDLIDGDVGEALLHRLMASARGSVAIRM